MQQIKQWTLNYEVLNFTPSITCARLTLWFSLRLKHKQPKILKCSPKCWAEGKVGESHLMSPSFLLMAEPMVDRAAEVFCPA